MTTTQSGAHHRLAGPDRAFVDPAVGDDGCAQCVRSRSSGTTGSGGLRRMPQGQEVGRRDDALAAPPVEAHLEHGFQVAPHAGPGE